MRNLSPESEAFLAHYGVKGMKWGVIRDTATRAASTAGATIQKRAKIQMLDRKKATSEQITEARERLAEKNDAYRAKYKEYKKAKKDPQLQARLEKNLRAREKAFLKNPDRVIAMRMTLGEGVMMSLGIGRAAATNPVAAATGAAAAAARITGNSIAARRIDYKQRTGAYNNAREGKVRRSLTDSRTQNLISLGTTGVAVVGGTLHQVNKHVRVSDILKGAILNKANENRMKAAADAAAKKSAKKVFEIASEAAKTNYAKKGFRGAYKITTMK